MAQVSYGTITITDTNDIERIYTVYAKSANNTTVPAAAAANWKESISEAPGTGNYIWQRTVVQKSGTQEKTYSDPVCLTGEEGTDGRGITSITIKYGTSADWNTQPSSWYDNTPEYSSSMPKYWTQTTISYTSGNPTVKVTQDKALTQAIYDSVVANSLAQSANENANGAMGQAASNVNEVKRIWFLKNSSGTPSKPTSSTTIYNDNAANHWTTIRPTVTGYRYYYYCEQTTTGGGVKSWSDVYLDSSELSEYEIGAMKTRFQNFFYPGDSNYPGAYAVGKSSSDGLDITDVSTYGYNLRLTPTALSIGYNELKAIEIDGATPALNFYKPSKTSQGAQTARLDANGLVLSEGGIVAGTKGQTGYIYLSTANHPVGTNGITINGFTPTSSTEQWREVIGTKFGVTNAGTLYANNAVISGTITVGSGSTIDSGATIGGTSASTVVSNAATGAQASSDLSDFQTTVANTYATQGALSDVEGQIPSDINELSDTDGIIPNDLSQLTDTTNRISGAVSTGVAGKADKTEAVCRTQRIYYRKTNSGAPSENTTWLTSSGTGYGNWSLKIPQLTSGSTKYPYLYTAVQTQTISQYNSSATTNNCTCSTVLLDDSTTVIDGGTIITGSIAANRLDVYDASINKISASAIDVSSITIGQNQVTNLTTTLSNKASINAEYSVEIITSNFNPAATTGNLVTLTAKVTRVDGGSVSGLTYQWFGDNTSLGAASASATSYNVPYNTTYTTFTVEIN